MGHTNQMPIATKSGKINISSEKETKKIAEIFSRNIKLGDVVFLYGEVGVGKTTFIKYTINALQYLNKQSITEITSPTFSILNQYKFNEIEIDHYDLYRIKNSEDFLSLSLFEDYKNKITLIEWPELIKYSQSIKKINLYFEYSDDLSSRFLTISSEKEYKFINEFK
mgnify:FL=1